MRALTNIHKNISSDSDTIINSSSLIIKCNLKTTVITES